MKLYTILSICALALASCTGNGNKGTDTTKTVAEDTSKAATLNAPAQNMEYCFLLTEGTSNQDTTAIHLIINAEKVNGEMQWLPKEKDARKGTLEGTMKGNDIKAVWTFMQEGTKDTMAVAFQLSAQELGQKPFKVTKDGRQETDGAAGYTIIYKLDNCSKFKTAAKPAL
ncbi:MULTISPECIES: hypothetical protein [unclassified Mucilaginibacter]|uniref:hypothetical protein n=1 Tax=unclassified Mucilaginibacter TaxID=2617802 RepID=UPI002AC966A3|nr:MULTISPECIES: hypothetical protein [unclassified Mucilaginibacter]MEB0263593.1 hypothetical protein [Mucilaginibacter sp. 10I4]MEB0280756.1 hypothetical protein [Mucilaginibacter sp. 10B2]MEB0301473.1 hypothetical protein [Mucilaginibacter sp. 5C4]WPX22655.1 hypothetical protein RHM67_15340 [Mucilaginibacter sp. 5C4]